MILARKGDFLNKQPVRTFTKLAVEAICEEGFRAIILRLEAVQ